MPKNTGLMFMTIKENFCFRGRNKTYIKDAHHPLHKGGLGKYKVATLLAGITFAENLMIFGLHSTPANTTHVPLKTADPYKVKLNIFMLVASLAGQG